jgi:adenylosuccinate lyase
MTTPPDDRHNEYENPLATRYAGEAMRRLFSARHRILTWRRLWIWLAEAEQAIGLPITDAQLAEMRAGLERIDFDAAARYEKRFRHDVMAHVHTFGDVAPAARPILHLGATSCFVTDNADSILVREALGLVELGIAESIAAIAAFARRWKDAPCLAYTHFQPAQPTTVGKRACLWLLDLVDDLSGVRRAAAEMPFLGSKGTTGTQASFVALFSGSLSSGGTDAISERIEALDADVARRAGFPASVPVSGQTYSRRADWKVMAALGGVAISASRFANDVRLLSGLNELSEPFEEEQIGSSAMAYKRNPMRCERMTSLARFLLSLVPTAGATASAQWLERTLDDSAARRLFLPEGFLTADAILRLLTNVGRGLVVNEAVVRSRLMADLPFMATEEILMRGVRAGGDRQTLHEQIRRHSLEARRAILEGGARNDLLERLKGDDAFAKVRGEIDGMADPRRFVGLAPRQVERFLVEHVEPALAPYRGRLGAESRIDV